MNKNWDAKKIIGILLGIISLVCIISSICLDGNSVLLSIGLSCCAISILTKRKCN